MVGSKAYDFKLKDQHGNNFVLSENLDSNVMLVFYPKDNTYVCSKQLNDYNNNLDNFIERGLKVVGISVDSRDSHSNFSKKCGFKFPILSDEDKSVSKKYGALNLLGMSKRKIIIVDKELNVIYEDLLFPLFYRSADRLMEINLLKNEK